MDTCADKILGILMIIGIGEEKNEKEKNNYKNTKNQSTPVRKSSLQATTLP